MHKLLRYMLRQRYEDESPCNWLGEVVEVQ